MAPRLGGDACDSKPESACVAPSCVWCTSAAVGGGCYTPSQAKMLPSAIFKCKASPGDEATPTDSNAGDS
jgi:hypothetical protein